MAAMDEFKKEREAVKNGTLKQKLSYFWDYYKWYVIIPLIIIIAVSTTIYNKVTAPDILLNGILLNCYNLETEQDSTSELYQSFYERENINTEESEITLNTTLSYSTDESAASTNYSTLQALMAWTGASTLDFLTGNKEAMTDLSYRGYFVDLREFLTEEQIEQYEPYFLYMDQAVVEKRELAFEKNEDASTIVLPDASNLEDMEEPIPVMIDVSQSEKLAKVYGASAKELTFGVVVNAPNPDMIMTFIDYLME